MRQIIKRNWNLRPFGVRVNVPSRIRQVQVPIWGVITPIRGLPNPIAQVAPLMSLIRSYPPHHSHLNPTSLSFSSTTLPSLPNTKLIHPSLSPHAMIMSCTESSIQWVQHRPEIVCFTFLLMITSWPLNVASGSGMPPYSIDRHQSALCESWKVKSRYHITTVASWLADE